MLYGIECWSTTKAHEHKIKVAEMRMLRRMCGLTRLDRIRNEVIRDLVSVVDIGENMRESRLRWFGHVDMRHPTALVWRCESLDFGEFRHGRERPRKS